MPVLIRLAFGTAFPLPQGVGTFAEALMLRFVPEVVSPTVRPSRPLPCKVSVLRPMPSWEHYRNAEQEDTCHVLQLSRGRSLE
jgi:hypothetical protein